MASSTTTQGNVTAPSRAQLALALMIAKYKPASVDIQAYILQIRAFVRDAKTASRGPSDKFFDSVAFWQQAYEKSTAEESRLLDRIFELEQRNAVLAAKLSCSATASNTDSEAVKKRKASAVQPAGKQTTFARKRAKTQRSLESNLPAAVARGATNTCLDEFEYVEGVDVPFMRQIYWLQKALLKKPQPDTLILSMIDLAQSTAGFIRLIENVDCKAAANDTKSKHAEQGRPTLAMKTFHAFEYAVQLLYSAFAKLSGTEQGPRLGPAIYHLTCLFEATAQTLQERCKHLAERSASKDASKLKRAKTSSKSKKSRAQGQSSEPDTFQGSDEIAIALTRLMATMSLSLDMSRREDRMLLDGYLYILLTRIGVILSMNVFADPKQQTSSQANPANLPAISGLMSANLDAVSRNGTQRESRYLIWLLERMLALASTATDSDTNIATSLPSKSTKTLQSTLLQAVFGAGDPVCESSLQTPQFMDISELSKPVASSNESAIPPSDWFVQEVWRLLGWSILETRLSS